MSPFHNMTPKDHVFRTLENLIMICDTSQDFESERFQMGRSLRAALSWEPALSNVELTGAAQLYRAASSDRRERG
jgi:hypothetical protein